ncbi:PREDICTED: serine palmitoyltransferase small subunit A, partial [Buceros rhinoceros silvestris]|uniref:serine palmitoyltransferase small subunit A n=1 Tax=Buceros rhinoceros silvestris TaxID=175836 RepID=UPI0005288FDC
WAGSAGRCTDAAQTRQLRELMVHGSAACAPESDVSAHSMLVSIVGMALYTGYVFMPQHIMAILHYFEIVQ